MTTAYLSLGSNMGDKLQELQAATDLLSDNPKVTVEATSDIYQTLPVGGVQQDDFYNIALRIETTLAPQDLLDLIHKIEQHLHRVRKIHWGPRTLDIDIILYGKQFINTPTLIIPHPEMNNRRFVLEPLMSIYKGDTNTFLKHDQAISGQDIESVGDLIKL